MCSLGQFSEHPDVENTWGPKTREGESSKETAALRPKLQKDKAWQLMGTNEARNIITFKQISFG